MIIAASHNSEGNNLKPIHMSVTAWIEVLKDAVDVIIGSEFKKGKTENIS